MKVTVINHSSLLINISDKVILTDFWNLSPAFGSWLPSALPFYNPIYLAGLSYNENFYLALSHAHDDHLDDEFFKNYFNKNVKIIINEFPGPSLKNRLKKIGFNNFVTLNQKIKKLDGFEAISVFDDTVSNDDCGITFRDEKHCVHHGNDNWFELKDRNITLLKEFSKNRKFLYCAQANSASGFPITYPQFGNKENRKEQLKIKIKNMVKASFKNINQINADYFLPYAGYARPYVLGKDYNETVFHPTYKNIKDLFNDNEIDNIDKMLDIFCGGTFDFKTEKVSYPFGFDPDRLLELTDIYLQKENYIKNCDTFKLDKKNKISNSEDIKVYLQKFNDFVLRYLKKYPNFYKSVIDKKICFEIIDQGNTLKKTMQIGSGKFLEDNNEPNKKMVVESYLFKALIDKKIVFENLYGGYEAEFYRYPLNKYNRDIAEYLIMFGYFYKNSNI